MGAQEHIRKQSGRLTQGKKLRHCKLVNAYDPTIAPILKGKSHGPAQFGRKPGIVSEPATGFIFANTYRRATQAISAMCCPCSIRSKALSTASVAPRLRFHSWRGTWVSMTPLRQLCMRGACSPSASPRPSRRSTPRPRRRRFAILTAAGLSRQRTPHQVQLACACGYSRPVVESHIASLLARGAGHVRYKGLQGAVVQQGMTVMAHNGRRWYASASNTVETGAKVRRLLGLRPCNVNQINTPKTSDHYIKE